MTTLRELLEQKAALDREINAIRTAARDTAIAEIRSLMALHGLTVEDFAKASPQRLGSNVAGRKVSPKFRDPDSGATWTGRGLKPRWLAAAVAAGRHLDEFAI